MGLESHWWASKTAQAGEKEQCNGKEGLGKGGEAGLCDSRWRGRNGTCSADSGRVPATTLQKPWVGGTHKVKRAILPLPLCLNPLVFGNPVNGSSRIQNHVSASPHSSGTAVFTSFRPDASGC